MTKKAHYWFWGLSGFFIFIDQVLKYFARTNPTIRYHLIPDFFGWEFYANTGIAFSIPFPMVPLVLITLCILGGLIYALQENNNYPYFILGAHLVIAGAISNLIDRIFFAITVDYIRIAGSVANIADGMLIIGTVLLFIYWGKRNPDVHNNS